MKLNECFNLYGEQDDRINAFQLYDEWKTDKELKDFIRYNLNKGNPIITKKRYEELWERFKAFYQMGVFHCDRIHAILIRLFNEYCR